MQPTLNQISVLCLQTASCNELSNTFQDSVYTQLHVTNSQLHFKSLSPYSLMQPTLSHISGLRILIASCNQLLATFQVSVYIDACKELSGTFQVFVY